MELKVIFLEIVYLDLYSDKVWGFSIFSFCTPPGDIYGRPLLNKRHTLIFWSFYLFVIRYRGGGVNVVLATLRDDNSSNCVRRFLGGTATVH